MRVCEHAMSLKMLHRASSIAPLTDQVSLLASMLKLVLMTGDMS